MLIGKHAHQCGELARLFLQGLSVRLAHPVFNSIRQSIVKGRALTGSFAKLERDPAIS